MKLPPLLLLLLSLSCSTILTGNFSPAGVVLSQPNFAIIRTISGNSSAFGLFGNISDRAALYAEAKQDMMEKSEYILAGKARALVNITVDYRSTKFLFTTSVECRITADVIEFK
jgi:hypothetical protein